MNFIVFGDPIPKARPRMTKTGHVYTPQTTKDFEYLVATTWASRKDREIVMLGPIEVDIAFFLKKPKTQKNGMPICRPDLDNLGKAVLDALNDKAWADDSQVVSLTMKKYYVSHTLCDGKPRTEISIRRYV